MILLRAKAGEREDCSNSLKAEAVVMAITDARSCRSTEERWQNL